MKDKKKNKYFKKTKWIMFSILLLVNVALICVLCWLNQSYHVYDRRLEDGSIVSISQKVLQKEVQENSEDAMVDVVCNVEPSFEEGGKTGNVYLHNSYENKMKEKLIIELGSTKEVLLETNTLNPGETMNSIGLQKQLAIGDYKANGKIVFYNDDGTVNVENKIDMILHIKS